MQQAASTSTATVDTAEESVFDLDATLAVQAAQHAAIRDLPAALAPEFVCDDSACAGAYSHRDTCVCSCGGEGHGIRYRKDGARGAAALQARIVRTGDVFLGAAAHNDEAW